MNSFTKEELQIIHLDMTTYVNTRPMLKESPIHKKLRDKIQLMIDNYCEHNSEITWVISPHVGRLVGIGENNK